MKYKEAQELNEAMTKWQEDHAPDEAYPAYVIKMLEAMKAYSLEITRLSVALADEIVAADGLSRDLDERNNWSDESVWPPEVVSVEELIEKEDYEDPTG